MAHNLAYNCVLQFSSLAYFVVEKICAQLTQLDWGLSMPERLTKPNISHFHCLHEVREYRLFCMPLMTQRCLKKKKLFTPANVCLDSFISQFILHFQTESSDFTGNIGSFH